MDLSHLLQNTGILVGGGEIDFLDILKAKNHERFFQHSMEIYSLDLLL